NAISAVLPSPFQLLHLRRKLARRADEIRNDPFIDIELADVLARIAQVVGFREHAPDFGTQSKRVRQYLEHDVAVVRAVSVPAQGRKAHRMGGVIREVESAVERKGWHFGVLETSQTRFLQAHE